MDKNERQRSEEVANQVKRVENNIYATRDEIKEAINNAEELGINTFRLEERLNDDKNQPPNGNGYSDGDLSFLSGFANGKFFAKDTNGNVIEADNNYELNNKLAQAFKNHPKYKDKIPTVTFHAGKNNVGGISLEQSKRDFAKAFIMNGVIPRGDIPQDKEFWQQLKNEYLSNKENSVQMWDKLTQHVPDDVMRRPKQKQDTVEHLKNLRKGINTKLTPVNVQSFARKPQSFSHNPNDWKIAANMISSSTR